MTNLHIPNETIEEDPNEDVPELPD